MGWPHRAPNSLNSGEAAERLCLTWYSVVGRTRQRVSARVTETEECPEGKVQGEAAPVNAHRARASAALLCDLRVHAQHLGGPQPAVPAGRCQVPVHPPLYPILPRWNQAEVCPERLAGFVLSLGFARSPRPSDRTAPVFLTPYTSSLADFFSLFTGLAPVLVCMRPGRMSRTSLACGFCCAPPAALPGGCWLPASLSPAPTPVRFIHKLGSRGKVVLHVKHGSTVTGEKPSNNENPQGNHLIFPAFSHGFLTLGSAEGKN